MGIVPFGSQANGAVIAIIGALIWLAIGIGVPGKCKLESFWLSTQSTGLTYDAH